jgi:hypothetical protein
LSSADYALSRVDSAIGRAVKAKKKFLHAKEYAIFQVMILHCAREKGLI